MEEKLYKIIREYYKDFFEKKKTLSEIIVKDSFPIVWFGDMRKYFHSKVKVVTIGLNPSNSEFPMDNPNLRFPGAREAYGQGKIGRVCDNLNGYFDCKRAPYYDWFIAYERALSFMSFGITYGGIKSRTPRAENYAVHIDFFSASATNPTYSHLHNHQKKLITRIDLFDTLFSYMTDNWNDSVIILFSTSKDAICAHFGLTRKNRIYEVLGLVEVYKVNNKIFIWGKPKIKPFQGVKKTILKKSLDKICHILV